jgi:hypothetical protein
MAMKVMVVLRLFCGGCMKKGRLRRLGVALLRVAPVVLLAGIRLASAAGFGIAGLDQFLNTFSTGVTGAGVVVGGVGLLGYVGSLMDNPFSTILSGSVNYFTKAGILGGGTAMLNTLGLAAGATL